MSIQLPVSIGEALDKFSILEIKIENITQPDRVEEIRKEIDALKPLIVTLIEKVSNLYSLLKLANIKIWDLSDEVRQESQVGEREKLFQRIFDWNDARFRIKNKINNQLNSNLKEQKSYSLKICLLYSNGNKIELYENFINYMEFFYDKIYIDLLPKDITIDSCKIIPLSDVDMSNYQDYF